MNKVLYENLKLLVPNGLGELEKEIGVSKGYFSRKADNNNQIDYHTIMKLGEKFGMTFEEMVSEKTTKRLIADNFMKQAESIRADIENMKALADESEAKANEIYKELERE